MLRKFRVSNFKSFQNNFELDLTDIKGYEFNKEKCIYSSTVNSAIVYGENGVGKSNLALAMFDIIEHLTDKKRTPELYNNYLNALSQSDCATFYFEVQLGTNTICYEYKKTDYKTLVYEKLTNNGNTIILYDRQNDDKAYINLPGTENLNKEITNSELSVLKYVKSNSELNKEEDSQAFTDFMNFVEKMLFFKHLDNRIYLGLQDGTKNIFEYFIENKLVKEFEGFLNEAGVECKLQVIEVVNSKTIYFDFNGHLLPFDIASTGTQALTLFFYWYQCILKEKVPFLVIDEFDAFYHHRLSKLIVKKLLESKVQFILTSHNVAIMTNDLLRPDCYFSMNKEKIVSFANLTEKDLRQAHNLEKMYKGRMFDVE